MLGVPTDETPAQAASADAEQGDLGQEIPETPIAALFHLADQVRSAFGNDVRFTERDGELVVAHVAESEENQPEGPREPNRKTRLWKVLFGLGLAAGVLFLLASQYVTGSKSSRRGLYHPATLEEAHRFLAKNSVDPQLSLENRPFKKYPKRDLPELKLDDPGHEARQNLETPDGVPLADQSFAPMPAPLTGQIGATLPNPSQLKIEPKALPAADLHDLEAKLRTCVSANGGRVGRVSEGDGGASKSFYVSVPTDEAQYLATKLERTMAGHASVSGPSEDDSGTEGIDPVKAAEIKAAESSVASLKKQLDQDEISFLPEAPVLKSIRAQYAEAIGQLANLRKISHPNSIIRVTLASG